MSKIVPSRSRPRAGRAASAGLWIGALLAAAALFALGRCSAPRGAASPTPAGSTDAVEVWTCPMHPEVRLPEFGPCPKCGMDLVGAAEFTLDPDLGIELSSAAQDLAGVRTATVERRFVERRLRLAGAVHLDETATQVISASVNGRLERLFADYVGMPVSRGDHLVEIFSPGLLSAQTELIAAAKRIAERGSDDGFLNQSDVRAYQSARTKLTLWGLSLDQVDAIEARGSAEDRVVLESPVSGVILAKQKVEGQYVSPGQEIYRVSDLSSLWIELQAFERDLAWLRYGQTVEIEVPALPGHRISGTLTFIDPVLDPELRTARARIAVANSDGALKPGMFVSGVVHVRLGAGGPVVEGGLDAKWICPMHHEVVDEAPNECRICGMALVEARRLGLVAEVAGEAPLVVPRSALLGLRPRAIVYVARPLEDGHVFEPREVRLGPLADDFAIVTAGLSEGEVIAIEGAFRIDAETQIRGGRGMLERLDAGATAAADPALADSLAVLLEGYLELGRALAADDFAGARLTSALLGAGAAALDWAALAEEFDSGPAELDRLLAELGGGADIAAWRVAFEPLSEFVIRALEAVGTPQALVLERVHCPMAFDFEGADWVQSLGEVRNPYFGAEMLNCGTRQELY